MTLYLSYSQTLLYCTSKNIMQNWILHDESMNPNLQKSTTYKHLTDTEIICNITIACEADTSPSNKPKDEEEDTPSPLPKVS